MAKRKSLAIALIGLLTLAGAASLLLGGCGGGGFRVDLSRSASSAGEPSFELTAELSGVGATAMVYKVKAPDVTIDKVTEMGRKLGFGGEAAFIDGGEKISMVDESGGEVRQLMVWVNSGTVEYHFVEPDKLYPPTPPTLPSYEEAGKIAMQFLAEAGLLPDGAQVREVKPGGSYGGPEGEHVAHLLVSLTHEIDGVPLAGPGAKFGVRIGDGGEVVDFYRVWRETEPYKEISIKAPQEAYQDLLTGKGSYLAPSRCKKVVVESVSLAYWMEAADEKQEYVIPVYQFSGKCLDGEGNYLEDFVGWCQATS
jgi:hypothetical protein